MTEKAASGAKLSVVTSLYQSEPTLDEFHRRVAAAADQLGLQVEFIYVNDGSTDRSLQRVLRLRSEDPRIVILDLARNFGHHPALMTGLERSSGEFVFLIDSDLEEAPELLAEFWDVIRARPSADAVYGVQPRRKGGKKERITGSLWYGIFCRLTPLAYPADSLTARLMTRRFVSAALLHQERDLDMMGVFALTGYEQIPVPATKWSKGTSTYTTAKRLGIAITGLTSFTTLPLTVISSIGSLLSLAALLAAIVWAALGWSGIASFSLAGFAVWSIWFLGGVILTAVGVVALYIGPVLQEVKARPRAIVRSEYGGEEP